MKTPMQELIEWINSSKEDSKANGDTPKVHLDDLKEFADVLLKKEKEVMCEFAFRFNHDAFTENYIKAEFEETFNNK